MLSLTSTPALARLTPARRAVRVVASANADAAAPLPPSRRALL